MKAETRPFAEYDPLRVHPRETPKRKSHINLREIPGTPAGCWDTLQDKQGCTGRCPRDFLAIPLEKLTEKDIFAGTLAWCPGDARLSRVFSDIFCDFSYVPLLLPKNIWELISKSPKNLHKYKIVWE